MLKSPVSSVGMPARSAGRSPASAARISGSRVERSSRSTCCSVRPSWTASGPYGSDVRCTLPSANTWPGRICASTYCAVRLGRVDQRVARDDVQPVAPVRPADRLRDPARVALGLLEPDDVGAGAADDLADLAEVDHVAAEPDVERHDLHVVLRVRRRGRGEPGGRQERQQDEVLQPAHGANVQRRDASVGRSLSPCAPG